MAAVVSTSSGRNCAEGLAGLMPAPIRRLLSHTSSELKADAQEGPAEPEGGEKCAVRQALEAEIESLRRDPPPFVSEVGVLKVPVLLCSAEGELEKPKDHGPWDFTVCVRGGFTPAERATHRRRVDQFSELRDEATAVTRALADSERALKDARDALAKAEQEAPSEVDALAEVVAKAEEEVREGKRKESEATAALLACSSSKNALATADAYDFPFKVGIRFGTGWPERPPETVRFRCVMNHALTDDEECLPPPFYRALPKTDGKHTVLGVLEAVRSFLVNPLHAWGAADGKIPDRYHESMRVYQDRNQKRLDVINKYKLRVRHKELFETPPTWRKEWFVPEFWNAHVKNTPEVWKALVTPDVPGEIYSFPLFTEEFCDFFVEELFNFYESGLPARRPNSMNNYGIILNEIGLEPMIDKLQEMFQPLGELFFPGPGCEWDGHHCFIVRYRGGEDLGLDMHTDDSDVTFNICLGLDFKGAGLQFCGVMGSADHRKYRHTYQHVKGRCVFHLGRMRHGADDITSGERLNLILWNHSTMTYRCSTDYTDPPYDKEAGPPDKVCVSYTHDRDYGIFKKYPAGKEHFRGKGWCPPRKHQYDDFKPDSDKPAQACSG